MQGPSAQELLEVVSQAVVRVSADGRLEWLEPAFASKIGLALRPGQALEELLEPGEPCERIQRAVREGHPLSVTATTRDGRQVRVRVHPLAGAAAWVVIDPPRSGDEEAFAQVVKENARLLREARSALQVRDEFMSIASHELKTPLTPLKMSLYTMERRLDQGLPVERSSVVKSKRCVDRLVGLVSNLLDASQLELSRLAVERVPLELRHLVLEVVDDFRRTFGRRFDVQVPDERVWVLGDRDRMEQVLVNLLENALKYSLASEPIRVELDRVRGKARLRVTDRGIGIPREEQALVFERFYRARNASHRNFGGLGLGLYISRSILNLHGGELEVQSTEGAGSSFTIVLALMSSREVLKLPKRVLLLEEDAVQRREAHEVLRTEGFEVIVASDPAEALQKLAHEPVDLMVLSSELARRPGGGFLEALHASATGHPIPLLFGGYDVPPWAGEAACRCAWPYEAAELISAVREALGLPRRDGDGTNPPLPP